MRSVSPYEMFGEYRPLEDARLKEYIWKQEDTISGLAHREYGNWQLWRLIAERNRLEDVRRIEPGTILLIPEPPLAVGAFEN